MRFYLNRAFANEKEIHVINDVRLVDPDQPEHTGADGVCQIDHLVMHRWGAFIVESKSVSEEISVRDDGSGGDEWSRVQKDGQRIGIPSPVQQARRQADFLRTYLNNRCEEILGKMPRGLRTVAKIVGGSEQRGFKFMPIQAIVAISDGGRIDRVNGWKEPSEPFRTFVCKADLVCEKIRGELERHRDFARWLVGRNGDYGMWRMKVEELEQAARLLVERVERRASPGESGAVCRSCGSSNLRGNWGGHGYYWRCADCSKNTPMPTVCTVCGAQGVRGKLVRVRKDGPSYFRRCEPCGVEEQIWMDR